MRQYTTIGISSALAFFAATSAYASSPCYFLSVPCDATAAETTVSGGAYPSFADMFNINPASIPTISTPVGVEAIASTSGSAKQTPDFNFAFIKGYQRIGTAIASNSDNTFYSYNLVQASQNTSYGTTVSQALAQNTVMPTLNIGTAIALVENKLQEQAKRFITPSLGLNLRYNKVTRGWDFGYGLSGSSKYFSVGLSYIANRGSRSIGYPDTSTTTFSLGTKLQHLNFEYTALYYRTSDPTLKTNPAFSNAVQIFTGSAQFGRVFPSMAYRRATNIDGASVGLLLVSLQYQLSDRFVAALLHNYLPGSSSAGLQVFF